MQPKIKGYPLCFVAALLGSLLFVATVHKHQKIIGEAIRRHRKQAGLTQEKLAEKADLHPVYIGEVERGEESASVEALVRIANALDVRLKNLVTDV